MIETVQMPSGRTVTRLRPELTRKHVKLREDQMSRLREMQSTEHLSLCAAVRKVVDRGFIMRGFVPVFIPKPSVDVQVFFREDQMVRFEYFMAFLGKVKISEMVRRVLDAGLRRDGAWPVSYRNE